MSIVNSIPVVANPVPRGVFSRVVMPVPSLVAPVTVVVVVATPLLLTSAAASAIGIGCPVEGLDGSTTKKTKKNKISFPRPDNPLGKQILIPPSPQHPPLQLRA